MAEYQKLDDTYGTNQPISNTAPSYQTSYNPGQQNVTGAYPPGYGAPPMQGTYPPMAPPAGVVVQPIIGGYQPYQVNPYQRDQNNAIILVVVAGLFALVLFVIGWWILLPIPAVIFCFGYRYTRSPDETARILGWVSVGASAVLFLMFAIVIVLFIVGVVIFLLYILFILFYVAAVTSAAEDNDAGSSSSAASSSQ